MSHPVDSFTLKELDLYTNGIENDAFSDAEL